MPAAAGSKAVAVIAYKVRFRTGSIVTPARYDTGFHDRVKSNRAARCRRN